MREEIYRVVQLLANLDNSKQLSPEDTEKFVDFFVDAVISRVSHKIKNVQENFDFAIYDHPYFDAVSSVVIGEDFTTLLTDEIESM